MAYLEINISGKHCILNLWQATRTGSKGARRSRPAGLYKPCPVLEWNGRAPGLLVWASVGITSTKQSSALDKPNLQAHTTHTHFQLKSGSSSAPPTPGYTPYPSFLPIPAGLAHWAILIGLNVVCGKSRRWWPELYGMVWPSSTIKGKEVDLYSAFIVVPHTQGAQVRITECYLQITPYLPLPRSIYQTAHP